jgi:hypothetical protein
LLCAAEAAAQIGRTSSIPTDLPGVTLIPAPRFPSFTDRRLVLIPYLTLSERYDDNIFQNSANKEDDFVTTITPGIRLYYVPRRDTRLNFEYRADFDIYAENSDANEGAHRLDLRFTGQLTRLLLLEASERFSLTEDPGDRIIDPEDTGGNPESEQRRGQVLRNDARVRLGVQVTPRIDLTPYFAHLLRDVDEPDEVDETRYQIGGEIGYLTNTLRRNRAFASYDVTFFDFSRNGIPEQGAPPDETDFVVHTANVGYRHNFTSTLVADAAIGYAVAVSDSDDPNDDDESSVVGTIGFIKTLRTGAYSLRYSRSFTSGGGGGGRAVGDIFLGTFSANVTPKILATLTSTLAFVDQRDALANQAFTTARSDRVFWIIRPSLTYQMLRFWSFSVAYDYATTNADNNFEDRHDHRVTVSTQFTIRERLFLSLTYRYTTRDFDEQGPLQANESFDRNQVVLSITYAPPLILR